MVGVWTTPLPPGLWIMPVVGGCVTPVDGGDALVVDEVGATGVVGVEVVFGFAGAVRGLSTGVGTARWSAATEACGA